jgi:hypothetical protein
MDFSQLAPAEKQAVGIYTPFYSAPNKRQVLPFALTLYKQGALEGERRIESGTNIPFVASWFVSTLPLDMTRCRVQFNHNDEQLSYEVMLSNHEFMDYLIDLLISYKRSKVTDFPPNFYRKLLQYEEKT